MNLNWTIDMQYEQQAWVACHVDEQPLTHRDMGLQGKGYLSGWCAVWLAVPMHQLEKVMVN